jgi:hypothetical protein
MGTKPSRRALPVDFMADLHAIPVTAALGPDTKLLEAAHEAIELHVRENKLFLESCNLACADRAALDVNTAERKAIWKRVRSMLRLCGKLPATTPAGIFAKALLVEKTKGMAPALALSLARDLRTSPALRRALWPAEQAA